MTSLFDQFEQEKSKATYSTAEMVRNKAFPHNLRDSCISVNFGVFQRKLRTRHPNFQ